MSNEETKTAETASNATPPAPTLTELLAGMKPEPEAAPVRTVAPPPKPSVGRVVHYFENCQGMIEARAALVVKVHSHTCVNLTVFDGEGYGRAEISITQGNGPGSWNWPERV